MTPQPPVSRKRGLGWPWNNTADEFRIYEAAFNKGTLTWLYNWEMWKPQGFPSKLEYVPQVRTTKEVGQINQFLDPLHAAGQLHHFVGFNEPDMASQANLSASSGASLWKQNILPLKNKYGNVSLCSPAISNGPHGIQWLKDFFKELGGIDAAKVDVIVIHYYSLDVNHFKQYVNEVHDTFKKPIWITEFACTAFDAAHPVNETQVMNFMKEALKFLDGAAFVARYAWFGAMKSLPDAVGHANAIENNGQLTNIGKLYCAV